MLSGTNQHTQDNSQKCSCNTAQEKKRRQQALKLTLRLINLQLQALSLLLFFRMLVFQF